MCLFESSLSDLQLWDSELNGLWRPGYDEDTPKNSQLYSAVILAALEGTLVEEQFPLGDE